MTCVLVSNPALLLFESGNNHSFNLFHFQLVRCGFLSSQHRGRDVVIVDVEKYLQNSKS
jgi:hypothetical protein